ncbi:nuclear transport factor 2 family protein [Leifsonia sp. ku-ls]|nr:nuclear transport factor 2 family protein [Leifsonia sp. ku-ls]
MTDVAVPEPIQRFIDTTNRGDSAAFVETFTEDAYLNDWGRGFHGHEGVRSWDRTDNIGKNSHFELVDVRPADEPETYVVTLTVAGDGYNGTGPMTFTLRDGRIAALRISPN